MLHLGSCSGNLVNGAEQQPDLRQALIDLGHSEGECRAGRARPWP
jgi:hypothetical protein